MPKTTSIPRISIVVPVGSNLEAFEETLASVLQNRPVASEILVAHDGHYADPFQLGDEVAFVTADSASTVDLIMAGAARAKSQFVHVLTPGFQAVEDWTVKALERFDDQHVAVVAPVIKDTSSNNVVAAGWADTSHRLGHPIAAGQSKLPRQLAEHFLGAYLQASFWRKGVLQSLSSAFTGTVSESSYAFGQLILNAGWRSVLATECEVQTQLQVSDWDPSSFQRGRQVRAIRNAIVRNDKSMPLVANLLRSIAHPGTIAETLGQATFRGRIASVKRNLQISEVAECPRADVLSLHGRSERPVTSSLRRAA